MGESQNHRTAWVGRGLQGVSLQCTKFTALLFSFLSPQAEELLCCLFDSLTSDSSFRIESQSC